MGVFNLIFAFGNSGEPLTFVIVISGSILHELINTKKIKVIYFFIS